MKFFRCKKSSILESRKICDKPESEHLPAGYIILGDWTVWLVRLVTSGLVPSHQKLLSILLPPSICTDLNKIFHHMATQSKISQGEEHMNQ